MALTVWPFVGGSILMWVAEEMDKIRNIQLSMFTWLLLVLCDIYGHYIDQGFLSHENLCMCVRGNNSGIKQKMLYTVF